MLESLGVWISRIADTVLHEMGIVFRFATQSPVTFAFVAAIVVALLVVVALGRK
jgi:hypothetical protein